MASATTQNYLGKCKEDDCGYVIFATPEDIQEGNTFRDVVAGAGVFRVNNANWARCTNRHRVFPVKVVKGTFSKDHRCDSRCLNAKGWECTCSCGGANHGRGHVAIITNASELTASRVAPGAYEPGLLDMVAQAVVREDFAVKPPVVTPVLNHLGEVGKHITGEVTVDDLREVNGSTLYTFKSVNGGHVIKWFAPSYADPQWPLGKTFTLRAKVKAHKDFQGTPETVVIYAEEVE